MGKNSNRISNDLSVFFGKLKVKSSKIVVDSHLSIFKKLASNSAAEHDESSELTYVVNRLVRGLGSADRQVQQSYFAGLAVLPEVFLPPALTVEHVFNAVEKELHLINNFSKKEEGHVCMGQILAYGALIESGLLVKTGTAEEQRTVVKQLLDLSKKRSYLPHLVDTFLDKLITSADETLVSEIIWPEISEEITASKPVTLIMYHLALLCRNRFSSVVDADVHRIFGAKTVINSGNIDDITRQLTSVQAVSLLQHKLYMDMCDWIAESKSKTGLLKRLWSYIGTQYITTNCTPHKQAVALKIFMLIISKVKDISQVLTLLSPNFKTLLLHTGKDKKLVFDTIITTVTRNSSDTPVETDTLIEIIKILIFIDSKGTQPVINRLDEDGVLKLGKFLHSIITGSSTSDKKNGVNNPEKWSNRDKMCAVHALCRLIGHRECEKNIEWRTEQLKFLIDLGFFIDPSVQGIGIELACVVRDGLYSALNHRAQTLNDLRTILSRLVHHFNSRLSKGMKTRIKVTDEMQAAWKRLMTVIKSIEKKDAKDGSEKWQISIFHTMFLQIGLLLFQNVGFDKDCLEELHSIYERTGKKNSSAEEPHWTDVVIELFLSLLSRNNHLYRHVIGCVFSHLCPQLTAQNIHQILQVLDPKRESNPLIDTNENDENSDSEDEKVDEVGSVSSNEDDDDEDDDNDDDGSDEEEEEEGTVTDKLRMAVREALGDAGTCTDTESVDVDELDEEEGKRVDEALSLAFKSVRQARVKRQTAKQKTLTHFRIRVIDLLDIWLSRTSPPLDLVLDVMVTFLSLLEYSMTHDHEEPLESRTRVCLKKVTSIKKFSSTSEVTETQLADVFKVLLDKETKRATLFSGLSSVITDCCVFILKASQHLVSDSGTKIKISPVFCVCRDALNDFFVKRDCLLPLALCESIFRLPWKGTWEVASLLPNFLLNSDVRPFRQTQALYLLHTFFKNHRLLSDASRKKTKVLISISSQLHNVALKVLATDGPCRLQAKFIRELATLLRFTINAKWNAEDDTKETLSRLEKFIKTYRQQQNTNLSTSTTENAVSSSVKKRKTQSDAPGSITNSDKKSSATQNSSIKKKSRKSLQAQEELNIVTKKVKLNNTGELCT